LISGHCSIKRTRLAICAYNTSCSSLMSDMSSLNWVKKWQDLHFCSIITLIDVCIDFILYKHIRNTRKRSKSVKKLFQLK
jgi:hypothetical protein